MYHNVFYQTHINIIGGVETFLYELARLASDNGRDLTIVYNTGDPTQIKRLKKYCRCVALKDIEKPIICDKAFFNYGVDAINHFQAKEYIQIVHADFDDSYLKDAGYKPIISEKITKYYAVSKNNAKSFKKITGKDIEVLYNPIKIDDEPRILTLIAAQRMTGEKGGPRLEKLIQTLDIEKVPYVLHLFSTDKLSIYSPNVMYHEPTLDVRKWIKYADYMICLSSTEGYSYSVYESLSMGVPVIITPLPVLDELGVNENNAIIVNFQMSNLDVWKIYNKAGKFKFDYQQKDCKPWLKLLTGESTYTYVEPKLRRLQCIRDYTDTQLGRSVQFGEIYEVPEERAQLIIDSGFAKYY